MACAALGKVLCRAVQRVRGPLCRCYSTSLPPEMSPFAMARDVEAKLLQHSAAGTCASPPVGGELGHMESPEADAKVVEYIHALHDDFILSQPLPRNPRQAALQSDEEEEDKKEEDNIYVEMVRAKYQEMKRREKQNGIIGGLSNRYAREVRANSAKARSTNPGAQQLYTKPDTSSSSSSEPPSSNLSTSHGSTPIPIPSDPNDALRELKYRITMLQNQLQHQQQVATRYRTATTASQETNRWAFVSNLLGSWRGSSANESQR